MPSELAKTTGTPSGSPRDGDSASAGRIDRRDLHTAPPLAVSFRLQRLCKMISCARIHNRIGHECTLSAIATCVAFSRWRGCRASGRRPRRWRSRSPRSRRRCASSRTGSGSALFDRVGRRLRLTAAGRLFQKHAGLSLTELGPGHPRRPPAPPGCAGSVWRSACCRRWRRG